MRKLLPLRRLLPFVLVALATATLMHETRAEPEKKKADDKKVVAEKPMPLGNFSVSLAVKDINKSKVFYEKLGFNVIGGKIEQNWLILQSELTTIGLFQGMFPRNVMTFNPGWDHKQKTPKGFMDVRDIQARLEKIGMKFTSRADPASTGPANFVLADPDGNPIFFDQHVPAPAKTK